MNISINLLDAVGLGLIIECPTGIIYSNQVGGTSCLHPTLEGVYVPLRNDVDQENSTLISPENELWNYFSGPPHDSTGATRGLTTADADIIDAVLVRWRLDTIIAVDRERLKESCEAWVCVLVLGEDEEMIGVFRGLGQYPVPGVLTWTNTD